MKIRLKRKTQGDCVPHELKSRIVDFLACQRSVQCCEIGENLLGNAKIEFLLSREIYKMANI